MNKKNIIQIVVIVLAFGGSGLVLYNGLFKNQVQEAPAGPLGTMPGAFGTEGVDTGKILPQGDKFDITAALSKQRFQYGQYKYPVLSTSTEIGKPVANLIEPQATEQAK